MKRIIGYFSLSFLLYHTASAQDFAVKQLESSPRHHEWVKVKSGERQVECFVVYPEKAGKATAVIVIHENKGLTDWVKSFADQLAAAGYIAVAPDLLSDFSSDKKKTSDFSKQEDATAAIYQLNQQQVTADLNAVEQYASSISAANGKTASIGFCWGGGQSFKMAATNKNIKAALVFYGSGPEKEQISVINPPVYGFYGGNDQRINSGIPATDSAMKADGKTYDYKIYPGAGHAYMRAADDPAGSAENKAAKDQSWSRITEILSVIQ